MTAHLVGGPLDGMTLDQPPDVSHVVCIYAHWTTTYLRRAPNSTCFDLESTTISAPRTATRHQTP